MATREFVAIAPGVIVAMKFDNVVGGDPGYDSAGGGPYPYALKIVPARKSGDKTLNTEEVSWERIGIVPPTTGKRKPKLKGSTGLAAFRKSISRALNAEQAAKVASGEPV